MVDADALARQPDAFHLAAWDVHVENRKGWQRIFQCAPDDGNGDLRSSGVILYPIRDAVFE